MVRPAVAIRRIHVTRQDHFGPECFDAFQRRLEIIHLKPQQQSVPWRQILRIADAPVMMFLLPPVQLQDEFAVQFEPLVIRSAMRAPHAKQPLIPAAAGLHIADADQRLRTHLACTLPKPTMTDKPQPAENTLKPP
jgi:hypothetical protein